MSFWSASWDEGDEALALVGMLSISSSLMAHFSGTPVPKRAQILEI